MGGLILAVFNVTGLVCLFAGPVLIALLAWPRLLRRWARRANRPDANRAKCHTCGYDLRGIASPQCPECGAVREARKTPVELQAMDIVARAKTDWDRPLLYRPASEADFAGLDRDYYESAAERLASRGFRPVGDIVRIGAGRGKPPVFRTFVAADGQACAVIYHIPARRAPARLKDVRLQICEVNTEFTDGRFLETSNAEGVHVSTPAPEVLRNELPPGTDLFAILEEHERRRGACVNDGGASCVRYATMEDIIAGQERRRGLERAFRRRIGYVDPEEIRRRAILDGSAPQAASQLANAVDRIRRKYAGALGPWGGTPVER